MTRTAHSLVLQLCEWEHTLQITHDVALWIIEQLLRLHDRDLISLTILGTKLVWSTINDEPSVDHYGDLVTKLLCFIHAVSSQHNR